MSKAISVRLSEEILEELDKLAGAVQRSRTFLITEALKTYLEEYGEYRIALDRLLDKDDEIVASSELRRRLAL